MRNPLRKRYSRDLKRNLGRYVSIFLMLMVTIALMSGFLSVSDGVQVAFRENRKECKLEDGLFSSYNKINADTIHNVEKLGVSVDENYYVNENIKDEKVLRIYKNRENMNLVTVMKGNLPKNSNEMAIERLFAENNNIAIGDTIAVSGTDRKITGYVSLPDYSSLFEKNSDLMMDSFHFGIGIVTKEAFDCYAKDDLTYNYSYYFNNRDLSESEKRELSNDILDSLIENKAPLTNFCTAENNSSISFVEDDLASDVPLMKALLNIIIVIMAFVYSIVISSTIDAEATIIGTLLASGYGKHELIRHSMGLPIMVTFFSAVIGNLLGYTVM
ncbi:MAG: ABC transporter permease, partial [Lachnospiraceae bacterium]|nr:ABC transporter permease [Lachnospiraceae bacterium]